MFLEKKGQKENRGVGGEKGEENAVEMVDHEPREECNATHSYSHALLTSPKEMRN